MSIAAGAIVFLAQLGIKLTVLLGAVALLDALVLRRAGSAAARHLAWTCAVGGALLLPMLGRALPSLLIKLPHASFASTTTTQPTPLSEPSSVGVALRENNALGVDRRRGDVVPPPRESVARTDVGIPRLGSLPSLSSLLLVLYVAGVIVVLLKLAVDQAIVRRLVRRATPVREGPWAAALTLLEQRTRSRRSVRLLRSSAPILPLTSGVVRPVVLIPSDLDGWSAERREAVLLHELAHVRRHDCLTQTLAAIACAFYWPHPFMWLAAARLRVERELACDDLVVARGIGAHDYAKHLLEIARSMNGRRPIPVFAVSMVAASQLESRIRAVIDDRRRRGVPGVRALGIAAASMLAVVAPLAAVGPSVDAAPSLSASRRVDQSANAPTSVTVAPLVARLPEPTRTPSMSAEREPARSIAVPPPRAIAQPPITRGGEFRVRLTTEQEGSYKPGLVHLSLFTPGLSTSYNDLARFEGLSAEQLRSREGDLHFKLRGDAGVVIFTGAMRGRDGVGRFEFLPDSTYAAEFGRRGIGRLSEHQQFVLGVHDFPLALLDELAAQGYATPTIDEVLRTAMSSVDVDFVRQMNALGYRAGSLGALLRLSNIGVTPEFIRTLAANGQRGLSISELSQIRSRGERVDDRGLRLEPEPRAPRSVPTNADSPLNGTWKITARPDGWLKFDIEWADVNQWSRFIQPTALSGLSMSDLTASTTSRTVFRYETDPGTFVFEGTFDRGRGSGQFTYAPNQQFAETMSTLGVRELGVVSNHDLKNMGFYGMSAVWIREFQRSFGPLTKHDIIELAIREVTPAYARAMQEAGVAGADSVRTIVELRFVGIPTAFARDLSAVGYRGIPSHQLMAMYRAGVTADFVRRLQDAGQRDLTPEQLVELRRRR